MIQGHPTVRPALLALLLVLGCRSSTEPFDTVSSDVIWSELSVSPLELTPGSAVTLRVETTNRGNTLVSASVGCGLGLGFQIKRPDGIVVDPLAGVPWHCTAEDSHQLAPGETDTVTWQWTTPQLRGRYEVVGGLRVDGKIMGPSAPQTFYVR